MAHFLIVARNHAGVLARITSVVSSTGANIDIARACPMPESDLSVIEIEVGVDNFIRDRLVRKLQRIVDVVAVQASDSGKSVSIELGPEIRQTAEATASALIPRNA